jgi:glutamate synthase (ferredoxin)
VTAVQDRKPIVIERAIRNTDRTVGARLSGEIARLYGNEGLLPNSIRVTFRGTAGQSFGAFLINGVHFTVIGEANDYVGKGMAGGEIVLRLPETVRYASQDGNTMLYGATGGAFFAAGRVGERFAVRNSGATAVVEGVGDHGCEYMTSGTVVVLGSTGRNFGAGMTGGLAFVYDDKNTLEKRYNPQLIKLERITNEADDTRLIDLVMQHADKTASKWSRSLLDAWSDAREKFWEVVPIQ